MKQLLSFLLVLLAIYSCSTSGHQISAMYTDYLAKKIENTLELRDPIKQNDYFSDYNLSLAEINNELNNIWSRDQSAAFAMYLYSIWNENNLDIDNDYWLVLKEDRVKLELANLIGQSLDRCLISGDKTGFRSFVLGHIKSNNPLLRIDAVRSLGSVGDSRDIPLLIEIIKSEEQGFAEMAVSSLHGLHLEEARKALIEVAKTITRKDLLERLNTYIERYKEFGLYLESCSNKMDLKLKG